MNILTVCTGNICRSPAAEILLSEALSGNARVTSAGTHAMVGLGIPEEMLAEITRSGRDGSRHRAQQMTETLLHEQDLVIGLAREHRSRAARAAPAVLKRAVTLAELAACAQTRAEIDGETPAERLADVPRAVAAHRHVLATLSLTDVPDPFGGTPVDYRRSYDLVESWVDDFAGWVGA